MKSDLDILPKDLKAKSLSPKEIVLEFDSTMRAISFFREKQIALLGWEAWIQEPNGALAHSSEIQGTVSLEQHAGETWQSYVNWTTELCDKTIRDDYKSWTQKAKPGMKIFFCLSPVLP